MDLQDLLWREDLDPGEEALHSCLQRADGSITASFSHVIGTQKTATLRVPDATGAFHRYGLQWDPDRISLFIDDAPVLEVSNPRSSWREWPFDRPFYLIPNLAVGGSWGGACGKWTGSGCGGGAIGSPRPQRRCLQARNP